MISKRVYENILAGMLIIISLGMMITIIVVAIRRPLSEVEAIAMQAFSLLAALGGSYLFSRQGAENSAKKMFVPHARSALRRIVSLYGGISHVAQLVDSKDGDRIKDDNSRLLAIRTIVYGLIRTANDALEDWREVVPEAVDEVEKNIPENRGQGNAI